MRLVIRQFGGTDIAEVKQDAAGRLKMEVWVPRLEEDLRAMMDRLGSHCLPLTVSPSAGASQTASGSTMVCQISPPDPEFLRALAEALPEERIEGRRLRGVLMEG